MTHWASRKEHTQWRIPLRFSSPFLLATVPVSPCYIIERLLVNHWWAHIQEKHFCCFFHTQLEWSRQVSRLAQFKGASSVNCPFFPLQRLSEFHFGNMYSAPLTDLPMTNMNPFDAPPKYVGYPEPGQPPCTQPNILIMPSLGKHFQCHTKMLSQ